MKQPILLTITTVAVFSTLSVAATGRKYFTALYSPNTITAGNAFTSAVQERTDKINELIGIVNDPTADPTNGGALQQAVMLLGIYRAQEAVPVLAHHLTFVARFRPDDRIISNEIMPTEAYCPCAQALVEIGDPTVGPAMIRIVAESTSEKERNEAAWVLIQVKGNQGAIQAMQAVIADYGEANRLNLEAGIVYVQQFKPHYGYPKEAMTIREKPVHP